MDVGLESVIESIISKGCAVRLFSPMIAKGIGPASSPQPASSSGKRTRPRRIGTRSKAEKIKVLLVDDHSIIRKEVARILKEAGGIVVVGEVANGQAAIEAARSLKPDVAVMDVNMPEVDGVKATRAITEEEPAVKIIGLSIHDDGATRQAMLDAGACAYLRKDGSAEILIETVRRCVDKISPPPRPKKQ